MSKWIAEFELEDGDKMPEHMDLEYHGVKLDFHCRPIRKTYEDGLNEAWEVARNITCAPTNGGKSEKWVNDMFGYQSRSAVMRNYSASEAIARIKKHEEIKIGDEVTDNDGWKGVVTWISPDGEYLVVTLQDGSALRWKKEHFKKTGRHFPQIAEALKQMQEGEG